MSMIGVLMNTTAVSIDAKLAEHDSRFDKIMMACQKEFDAIHEEMDGMHADISEIRERMDDMATKQDLFKMEARIMEAIRDIGAVLKNHDSRLIALERIVKP